MRIICAKSGHCVPGKQYNRWREHDRRGNYLQGKATLQLSVRADLKQTETDIPEDKNSNTQYSYEANRPF